MWRAAAAPRQLSDEKLAASGVSPDLVRRSSGSIETIGNIRADTEQALKASK